MRIVRLLAYPNCTASDVSAFIEVLATANALWALEHKGTATSLFHYRVESLDGMPITTAAGLQIGVHSAIEFSGTADLLFLPGISSDVATQNVLDNVQRLSHLIPLLRQLHAKGCLIAGAGATNVLLAQAGLLDAGQTSTYTRLEPYFRAHHASVQCLPDDAVALHNNILTASASTAALSLGLQAVRHFGGVALAQRCAEALWIDAGLTARGSHTAWSAHDLPTHNDSLVHKAQRWLQRNASSRSVTLRDLTNLLSVSERTLIRRFNQALQTTPTEYVHRLKVDFAKRLLETSSLSLHEVSERIGYAEISSFQRLFKRKTGMSPTRYRQAYKRRSNATR